MNFDKTPEQNENNLENQRIDKMLNLMKTNSNFEYVVSINGNLSGSGETIGQEAYCFDQKKKGLERDFNSLEYMDISRRNPLKEGEVRFEVKDWKRESDGKEFRNYIYRLAFNGRTNNKFTQDLRPGVHISTALRVLKDKKIFDELPEQKLKEYISNPETEESKKFFGKLLHKANQEFIPEYWSFVGKERSLYLERNKK